MPHKNKIGMDTLRKRSKLLTSYMENMICSINNSNINIITPSDSGDRGSQLSLAIHSDEKNIELFLKNKNIICDFRKPNVIRAAPCAFYNSYKDIYNFVQVLKEL